MKNQAGTTRSTKQPRQLDQNSSFKSKLRLSKGKLGEIFKKPQYEPQLIALENTIVKFPLKKLVTENKEPTKDQQQNAKGSILTSTPHHILRSNAQFFSDRRPSSSISPIKQQKPSKDIENNEANGNPATSEEDSEVDLIPKKSTEGQSINSQPPDVKDNTQNRPKSSQNSSYRTRSKSNKSHADNTPLSTPAAGRPLVSEEKQAANDSIICVDSLLKDNDLSKETKEKTPNNLRRSRRDQHNSTLTDRLCRTKSDPSPFSPATKKSKIPLRTISQDRGIDANKENEKKDAKLTFIQPARITPSRSGQTQAANYNAVTPKNTPMVVDPDDNCSKKNNVLVEVAGSPVRNRDEFVNKTPRSNRQLHHTNVEENSEIPTKRKRYDTVSLAVQTKNIEQSRASSSEATQTSRIPTQGDSSNVKILKNEVLSSPFKLFRKANLDSQKNINKEVQTTFASTDSGEQSKPCQFRHNTRADQAQRKIEFDSLMKRLEEYAVIVDKVSDTNTPVADIAGKKKPRNNPSSSAKKSRGVLDKIVSKLAKTAENICPSDALKTPKSNPKASNKKPTIFRRSNRIASEKKQRHPAVIKLGNDSRESSVSRGSSSGRPNIFDSLEDGNVIDVVDFSNEGVPELSATEKPWRFEGSSGPMPFNTNLTLNFVRSEADIRYSENVLEQSSSVQISLESECGLDNQHEESKAFVKNNIMPNLLSRKSQVLLKSYSRNKSLAPNQNHDLCESIEETLDPVPTNNISEFKKPANPKPVVKKMALRTKSKKSGPPVNSSNQSNTEMGDVEASSQQLTNVEKESSKIMSPMQIVDKTKLRSQARKNLFGIQSAEPAPTENLSDETQTIADGLHSKKQLGSGNMEQSNIIEESRTSVNGSRRNRPLRSRKSGPKEDLDQPVNRNKKHKADVSSQSNILDTVSEPEANNNNTEFPEASPVAQLKEGNPKAHRQLEVHVEPLPINSLVNKPTPIITQLKQKKQKRKLPLRHNVTNEHGTTFLDHLIDASNIIQDIGGKRPQRERKLVKLSKLLDKPGVVLLPLSLRVTSSKPRKPRSKSSTTINNNGTTLTTIDSTTINNNGIVDNASKQTALSLAAGSSQSSVNLKSILTTELSGLEILPHGKKALLNNLETIMDKDDSQDNVQTTTKSMPATKSKRGRPKKATTTDTNFKKPAQEKPKLVEPIVLIENLRLNPVDEQPMVFESDNLPVVDDAAKIPDVSEIHCIQLDTVSNLGNIVEENAKDAFSLQDNVPPTKPISATRRKRGRPKKTISTDTILKKRVHQELESAEPIIHNEDSRLNPIDKQPTVFHTEILPMADDIADVSAIPRLPQTKEDTELNLGNTAEENANDAISLQDNQLFTRPKPPNSRRPGRPKKGMSLTKGKAERPKKKGAATNEENLEKSEEVRANEDNDIQMGLELRVPEIVLTQANQLSSQDENSVRPDLNNQPILNENGDHGDDRRSTFSDAYAYSLNPSPSFASGSNMTGFADDSDYIRTIVGGKPLNFKFASRLPTDARFKKVQNIGVTSCSKDPTTGLFSFGYLKIYAKDQKHLTVASYAFTFVVIKGTAHVEVEGNSRIVNEGECFMVPRGMKYAIKNVNERNDLLMIYTRIKSGST